MNLLEQVRSYESLPPAEQTRLQHLQLHVLFCHAAQHSTFWKERLTRAGFAPNKPSPDTLSQLPVLSRSDLQQRTDSIRAYWPSLSPDQINVTTTSGSTGTPVRVERFTPWYAPLFKAINRQDDLWHSRDPKQTLCVIGAGIKDQSHGSWGGSYTAFGLKGRAHTRALGDRPIDSHLYWLLKHKPRYLKSSPFLAATMAQLAIEQGVQLPVQQIITQSERVTPQHRALCQQAFGARIVDRYSCEEIGWIALQCPKHDHYHVMNPSVLVEIVDEQGAPCEPGQIGRVLLTSLHSYSMPIIRYEIGDLAEWGEHCDCGMTLPVIKRLWGRKRHMLTLPDGSHVPMPFLGDDIGKIDRILEFQIAQYDDGVLEIQLKNRAGSTLTQDETRALHAVFADNELHSLALRIREVNAIDWGPGWKREEFVRKSGYCPD
jgi:phenylacetate-CoA ligase